MPIVTDLPNTKGEREAVFVRDVAKIPAVIRDGKYATAADDNGAIGTWADKDGKYRCHAMRRYMTINEQTFGTLKEVKTWYAKWLKEIE